MQKWETLWGARRSWNLKCGTSRQHTREVSERRGAGRCGEERERSGEERGGRGPAAAAGEVVVGSAPRQRARRHALEDAGGYIRAAAIVTEEARFLVLGDGGQEANGSGGMRICMRRQ